MELFLSANIHQGNDLFSVYSRGRQCAFMCLSALLTARNNPVVVWSKTTLNNVLLQGNSMYLEALNNGLIVPDPGVHPDCKVCYARRRSSPRTFRCVRGKYIGYILSAQYFAKDSICRVEKRSKCKILKTIR